jgi:ubiquitin-like domain-containing CTD phosphatase 1
MYALQFMAAVYPYYDICVWSQTSWRWLEAKLTEMDCLTSERYKISFVLDKTPMFNITVQQKGQEKRKHQVKALQLLWSRFPQHYGPRKFIFASSIKSRN